jgi:tetratricopeptide (TPR) repeat protein
VRTFKREDHFQAAEIVLRHAQRLSPLNTDHYANLGRLYVAWGVMSQPARLAQAIEFFEKATQQSPYAPQLMQELARAHYAARQYDRAAERLAHAQRIMPGWAPDGTLAGDVALMRGDPHGALAAYASTFAASPPPAALTDSQVDWRLERLIEAGLADAAIAALLRARDDPQRGTGSPGAVQAKPQSDYAINVTLGYLYYRTKRLAEAIGAFEAAVRAQPTQWPVHRNLGLIYQELGQRDRALAALQQALRHAPREEHAGLQQLMSQLQRP